MSVSEKIVPFHVFQSHCDDRHFGYMGTPGKFYVSCKNRLASQPDKCNFRTCPVWNSDLVQDVSGVVNRGSQEDFAAKVAAIPPSLSLRDLNVRLKGTVSHAGEKYSPFSEPQEYHDSVAGEDV
jgi:hypothetical protein